ncbi:Os03g0663600 [Oryza sativa Japonica Group]|uniref:Os03g0663600 protein n=1 Tax=Oryza sativa subsp. japonica TaxID=39947 RepID=A0A0P0W106_ORYSJ|nr:hypothetical protein EE612_019464 [Oryza sativa]BAS85614.1 Os03g0663600 [Oryza sativa Japonica Group]
MILIQTRIKSMHACLLCIHLTKITSIRCQLTSHRPSWAEDDLVVGAGRASEGARLVVLGVAVGVRAEPLEELRVVGRAAVVRRRAGAAVLVLLEHRARVVAPAGRPQLARALPRHVRLAPRPALGAPGAVAGGEEVHGHVESVDEGDVEEVEVAELVQRELRQRVGRLPVRRAPQHAAAVARLAPPVAAAVEAAARARPHAPARRAGRHVDHPLLPRVQLLPAAGRHGCRPHGDLALVGDGERGGVRGGGEEEKREEAEDGGSCHCVSL